MIKNIKQEELDILLIGCNRNDGLVVKESLKNVRVIKTKLKSSSSFSKAMVLLGQNKYHLILLNLSDYNGDDLFSLRKLRSVYKYIPVVLLTKNKNKVLWEKAITFGAQDYLIKGKISDDNLFRVIQYSLMFKNLDNEIIEHKKNTKLINKIKDDSIIRVNHELNAPIAAISGAVEIFQGEMLGPLNSKYKKFANMIQDSAKQLLQCSNNLIELTDLDVGDLSIKPEKINIKEKVDEVCLALNLKAKAEDIILNVETTNAVDVFINADPVYFRQIITKLVEISFRLAKSKVKLIIKVNQNNCCIIVGNNGTGIFSEDLSKLFDKFSINKQLDKKQIWLILSLVLIKGFMEVHGGTIMAENSYDTNSNINGLQFIATLPLGENVLGANATA